MKILVDTNLLLDVALSREPFFAESEAVVQWCEANAGSGLIAWHSLSNTYYLLEKARGDPAARAFLQAVLEMFEVVPTGTAEGKHALHLPM